MIINQPIVDLRAEPHTLAQPGMHDTQQETQLLYGERVRVLEEADGWLRVEAMEQAEFSHNKHWQGYPGWVPANTALPATAASEPTIVVTAKWAPLWADAYRTTKTELALALGTLMPAVDFAGQAWQVELPDGRFAWIDHRYAASLKDLAVLDAQNKRRRIVSTAELLIGEPYLWGGRSPARNDQPAAALGMDCSGLTNLAYRTIGIMIPRDAHEQYLRAQKINAPQPGDLIFLSERNNPQRIVHVTLYAGGNEVIEAPGTGRLVRRVGLAERFGQTLDWVTPGTVIDGQTVYFGSYL